jgi:hypothetical protein
LGLAQENLTRIVYSEYSFAFRTAEPAGFQCLELLGANRAGKDLGEEGNRFSGCAATEEIYGIVKIILNIEELREAQKLKDFINLGLDFQQYQIPAPGLYRFEEGGKGTDAGGGYIVKPAALEHQADKSGFDSLGNPLLEIIGVIRIDVPGKIQDKTTLDLINFLKLYLEAFVFFVIESINNIVVCHDAPFAYIPLSILLFL